MSPLLQIVEQTKTVGQYLRHAKAGINAVHLYMLCYENKQKKFSHFNLGLSE